MATRSTIALEYADGTVGQIYCHWDGYLDHNGKILQNYYTDPFKVRALLDGGDTSTLADSVEDCEFYTKRGEALNPQRMFKDYAEYLREMQGEEYNYILRKDGKWYVEFYGDYNGSLTQAILDEQDRIAQEEME
jgi:hypothetical protein